MLHMFFHTELFPFFLGLSGLFLMTLSLNHNHTFPFWVGRPEVFQCLSQRSGKGSLMLLSQFPADRCPPVSQRLQQFLQCTYQTVRCFI